MSAPASKKICPSSDEQSNEDSIFPEEVSYARRCVSKWQRSQRDVNIKKLKEKSYTLAHKKGMLLVSNWSRHVTQCANFVANNRQQVLCFSSRSSSEPTPTLSSDTVSIDLTTDVDSVSIGCTSHESTQEDTDLGHSQTENLHAAAAIQKEQSPLSLTVQYLEDCDTVSSHSELPNAQQPSDDIFPLLKTQQPSKAQYFQEKSTNSQNMANSSRFFSYPLLSNFKFVIQGIDYHSSNVLQTLHSKKLPHFLALLNK